MSGAFDIDFERFQDAGGDAVPLPQKPEKDVFRAHVGVVQGFGLFAGQGEHLLYSGSVGDIAGDLGIRPGAHLLFHLHADGFQIEPHLL